MSSRILVTGTSVAPELLRPLVDAGYELDNSTELLSEQELRRRLKGCVGYLLGGDEFASRTVISDADDLRIIAFLGVGYSSFVDTKAATERGILVTSTPGTLTQSVAEFAVGQTLNGLRKLGFYSARAREAYMASAKVVEADKTRELAACDIGIVGLGAIGTRVSEILSAGFGCSLRYFSRTRKPNEEERLGLTFCRLDDLLSTSDIVAFFVPGDDATKDLVGADELRDARHGIMLVNITKPTIINAKALADGLSSGRVGSVVLDQFYEIGTPGRDQILHAGDDRLIVTPHLGSLTVEARDGMAKRAVASIINVLTSGNDQYVVNR
jgi:glyoxylate reductase